MTRVVVVLEGAGRDGVGEGLVREGGEDDRGQGVPALEVVHAAGSGDDALVELCAPGVVLVSADRGLRRRAEGAGAAVVGPRALLAVLERTR